MARRGIHHTAPTPAWPTSMNHHLESAQTSIPPPRPPDGQGEPGLGGIASALEASTTMPPIQPRNSRRGRISTASGADQEREDGLSPPLFASLIRHRGRCSDRRHSPLQVRHQATCHRDGSSAVRHHAEPPLEARLPISCMGLAPCAEASEGRCCRQVALAAHAPPADRPATTKPHPLRLRRRAASTRTYVSAAQAAVSAARAATTARCSSGRLSPLAPAARFRGRAGSATGSDPPPHSPP